MQNAPVAAIRAGSEVFRASDVSRSFGETRALRACSFDLCAGEVHAVMGENGSGKSTLVKIMSGILAPDSGMLELEGAQLARIPTPRAARRLGIATVYQEILVVEALSMLDNIWLGADGWLRRRVPDARKREEGAEMLARLLDKPPDLDAPLELLDLSTRQVCVIARALLQRPRLLILDEPTSALDVSIRDRLFGLVREFCAAGTAVVFISHRMDEIEAVADRVTVLRSGESVGTVDARATEPSELLRMMSGEEVARATVGHRSVPSADAAVLLRASGVCVKEGALPIDVAVRAGEIVGLAGLEGHGQEGFVRVLAGIERPLAGLVTRETEHGSQPVHSLRGAAQYGISYVPRDRKTEGVFEPLSIIDNFSLPTINRDARLVGLIRERRRKRRLRQYEELLHIKLATPRDPVTTLSGGNQQKVIIARWLAMNPRVIVLNDPTRGVDLGTKLDMYKMLGDLTDQGVAVIMLSTEVEEHLTLMDRVLVFREGTIFSEIERDALTRERLVSAFFGRHLGPGSESS